jgi:ubiquinone/menaquinone biosynthesis C-methylase UbiE
VNKILLDVGCGSNKYPGSLGIDIARIKGVDFVADVTAGLPFKDSSIDGVYASHVLEHFDDLVGVMNEIWRVCKPGGRVYITVPHASSSFMTWRDPTHRRGLSLSTFTYFDPDKFEGQMFSYYAKARFRPVYARLRFRSGFGDGNPVSKVLTRFLETVANRSEYAQYLCERWWGHWFGIAEAYAVLEAIK